MKLRLFVILAIFLLSGIKAFCQEKSEENYMFVYKNDKRPMFDGDMSLKKMNIWVESHLKYPQNTEEGRNTRQGYSQFYDNKRRRAY